MLKILKSTSYLENAKNSPEKGREKAHQCCRLSAWLSTPVPAEASSALSQTLQGWREAEWLENCLSFGHSVRHQKKD